MAVVKSDGYGHGMLPRARPSPAARWLGVRHLAEALALRGAGFTLPVLCLIAAADAPHAERSRRRRPQGRRAGLGPPDRSAGRGRAGPARCTSRPRPACAGAAPPRPSGRPGRRGPGPAGRGPLRITGVWSHLACADMPGHLRRRAARRLPRRARAGRAGRARVPTCGTWPTRRPRCPCRKRGSTWCGRAAGWSGCARCPAARRLAAAGHDRAGRRCAGQGSPGRRLLRAPLRDGGETPLGLVPLGYREGFPGGGEQCAGPDPRRPTDHLRDGLHEPVRGRCRRT